MLWTRKPAMAKRMSLRKGEPLLILNFTCDTRNLYWTTKEKSAFENVIYSDENQAFKIKFVT